MGKGGKRCSRLERVALERDRLLTGTPSRGRRRPSTVPQLIKKNPSGLVEIARSCDLKVVGKGVNDSGLLTVMTQWILEKPHTSVTLHRMVIKLVTFDALHTLLTPRRPIYVQYSEVFAPFLGALDPDRIRHSFKSSLKQIQKDKPAYKGQAGVLGWWTEVIKGTAIGAGARPQVVEESLGQIVPVLMKRFSSREGYKLFDDALPVLWQLRKMNVRTALVSNADSRMRLVLDDLDVSSLLQPLLLSDEVGIEKPDLEMFRMAQKDVALQGSICADESLHVGDELYSDYQGARAAGMHAMLLRRPGPDGDGEHKEVGEDLRHVNVVPNLLTVLDWVKYQNVGLGTVTR